MKKDEAEMVPGRESEQVEEDVMGWVEVRRRTRRRVVEEGDNDEGGTQDGPDFRQDERIQNIHDGCGTERQSQ